MFRRSHPEIAVLAFAGGYVTAVASAVLYQRWNRGVMRYRMSEPPQPVPARTLTPNALQMIAIKVFLWVWGLIASLGGGEK